MSEEQSDIQFKCRLPSELLEPLDNHTRHIYVALDKIDQQNIHIINEQVDVKSHLKIADEKLEQSEKDRYEMRDLIKKLSETVIEVVDKEVSCEEDRKRIHNQMALTDDRFRNINATLKIFLDMREQFLSKRKLIKHLLLALGTLVLLPAAGIFIGELTVEFVKKYFKW